MALFNFNFFKKKPPQVTIPILKEPLVPISLPKCPYCGFEFEKPLTRKRACPKCKQTIILRVVDGQSQKVLLTVDQDEKIEKELSFKRITDAFEKILREDGLSDAQIENHQIEWDKKTGGNRTVFDYFWSTLNELLKRITKKSDSGRIADVYSLMGDIASYEGRSSLIYDKECNAWSMIGQTDFFGTKCKIEVLTTGDSCPECLKLKGRLFTEKEFFKEKPIPVENCTHKYGCRCCTTIVIDE